MNKAILMGRLTKDPDVRYQGSNNMAVARYTLAVNRKYKRDGEPQADFIQCVAFGKIAEFAEKYFKKGNQILVEGHIQTGSYDGKDGKKVYTTDVIVESHEFAQTKSDNFNGATATSQPQPQPLPSNIGDGFMSIPDGIGDELPFN